MSSDLTARDRGLVRNFVQDYEDLTQTELSGGFQKRHKDVGLGPRDLSARTLWRVAQEESMYLACYPKTGLNRHHRSAREAYVRGASADVGMLGAVVWSDEKVC